jgi:hypothetical protein
MVRHFITHLIKDICQQLKTNQFNCDAAKASREPHAQIIKLQQAHAAATVAKRDINRINVL